MIYDVSHVPRTLPDIDATQNDAYIDETHMRVPTEKIVKSVVCDMHYLYNSFETDGIMILNETFVSNCLFLRLYYNFFFFQIFKFAFKYSRERSRLERIKKDVEDRNMIDDETIREEIHPLFGIC